MRLGLAYNEKPSPGRSNRETELPFYEAEQPSDAFVEWDDPTTIAAVEHALRAFGEVVRLEAIGDFAGKLASADVDLLFNMAEGLSGPNREAHVPAVAESLGVPYTASDPLTLALALHKARAKEFFALRDIPTAPFAVIESEAAVGAVDLGVPYPVFLKPVWEGSSKGIAEASIAETPDEAARQATHLLRTYGEPVLIESYLPGDEFTVAVVDNGPRAHALPLVRFRFDALPAGALPIMGYEAKWIWDDPAAPLDLLECPAQVPAGLERAITHLALESYFVLGCRDWARVDVRLDRTGAPNVIEVNPLPGILPDPADNSCFPCAARAAGRSYDELIQDVVRIAWRRITGQVLAPPAAAGVVA